MKHHTKTKGDIAVAKTILDLTLKGHSIFSPIFSEHLPYDLIAVVGNKLLRLQVKYRSDGEVAAATSWADKNGSHQKKYEENDFDYYALYLPDKDVVVYPSISFAGKTISTKITTSGIGFYWYEDFLTFTNEANKRTRKEFLFKTKGKLLKNVALPSKKTLESIIQNRGLDGSAKYYDVELTILQDWISLHNIQITNELPKIEYRKAIGPSKEELEKLIWSRPSTDIAKTYGVSDKAVEKWCKAYKISKPPRGYWAKVAANKV